MSEAQTIDPARQPLTIDALAGQLAACGLSAGQTVLAHTRMSAFGWIAGGAAEVRLMRQRPLVDFGVGWLEQHRQPASG